MSKLIESTTSARHLLAALVRRLTPARGTVDATSQTPATAPHAGPSRPRQAPDPAVNSAAPATSTPHPATYVFEARTRFRGRSIGLSLRAATADRDRMARIFRDDSLYALPADVHPRVIFDVGAGVGLSSVYFALTYPDADVFAFEPRADKLPLLRRNALRHSPKIHVVELGLGDKELGARQAGFDRSVVTIEQAAAQLRVDHVDLFKLDAPGWELAILRGLPAHWRRATTAFVGELHGANDFDVCRLLSGSHDVGLTKPLNATRFPFQAVRRHNPFAAAA